MLVSGTVDLRCGSVVLTVARWRGESNSSGATCAWGKRVSLVMMVTERILLAKKTQTMGV